MSKGGIIISLFKSIGVETGLIIFSYFVTVGLTWLVANRRKIKISFQSLTRWNKEIRISCAYLFRIKYKDKYVLIKGERIDQYQPIGGVYKYFPSFKHMKEKLEITDEQETSFFEENDLRIRTKGKYISKFIDWFDTRENREVLVNRELIEEVGLADDINNYLLSETKVEFIKQFREEITYSKHFKVNEIKIFDIFDLEIPDELLKEIIEQENIELVGKRDIEKECVDIDSKSRKISMTAKYTL